jgi:hypothetical protein
MLPLALALITFAIADLVSGGMAATPKQVHLKRHLVVTLLLSLLSAVAWWLHVGSWPLCVAYFVVLWVGSATWILSRVSFRRKWEITAILVLTSVLMAVALVFPALGEESQVAWLDIHLARLPWGIPGSYSANSVILAVALILFLGPTSNGIVRCCLQIIRTTPVEESEATLKGGRFIGPLERVLIFGLALAGQPTAAALIISAKSIIRFPELQSKSKEGQVGKSAVPLIDELTEYFLLGSLLSWALALLAALPLLGL